MAQKKVNGLTIAISADTSGVTAGLKDITSESISLSKQLKTVDGLLKLDPTNTELLDTRQKLLAESIETTRKKLAALKGAQEDVKKAVASGKIGSEEYVAFQKELVQTEKRLKDLEGTADDTGKEEEQLADATKDAGTEMQKTEKDASGLGESLKNGLAAGAKAAGAALVAVGAASVKLVKDVIEKTGELEQNLGGSESVFGDYAQRMQKAGEEAYKNLGISQSEYLATANKMGALLQGTGLDAEKSAEITEKAMQRAADMASVMGIDMSAAMESVAGAAKGNFTMMDNLGVAINDTTLKAYAAEHGLGDLSTTQDKVTAAMQMFLDTTEQYDGNFAKEATETISGSFGLLAASWDSLIAGLGNGEADISNLAGNVVDAFDSVVKNVEPVVDAIVDALPAVVDTLLAAVEELLPKLIPAFTDIFIKLTDTLVKLLPTLIPIAANAILTITTALIKNLPQVVRAAIEIITAIAQGIAKALPELIPVIVDVVLEIAEILTDPKTLMPLIRAAFDIINALIEGLLSPESIDKMIEMLPEVISNLVDILLESLDLLLDAAVQIITALCDYFFDPENVQKLIDTAIEIIAKICEGLLKALYKVGEAIGEVVKKIVDCLGLGEYWEAGMDVIDEFMGGVKQKWDEWADWWGSIGERIYDALHGNTEGSFIDEGAVWTPDKPMAVGGIVSRPTRALIGENGAEMVLPLERNTEWMDMLAARIGTGVQIGEINVSVSGADGIDRVGDIIVQKIDEALRVYQIQQVRGIGGTAWK